MERGPNAENVAKMVQTNEERCMDAPVWWCEWLAMDRFRRGRGRLKKCWREVADLPYPNFIPECSF